jgi:hypothetical protein
MRIARLLLPLLCAALSACNMATSEKPLFAASQRSAGLIVEDGLWTRLDPECTVDLSKPRGDWPKCAGWMIVQGSKIVAGSDMRPNEPVQDVFIVDGKPPLIQAPVRVNDGPAPSFYTYLVLEPMGRSAAGHITRLQVWPVACGITKPDGKVIPWTGFDKDCRTKSVAVVRSAAAKPRPADVKPMPLVWVRAETP